MFNNLITSGASRLANHLLTSDDKIPGVNVGNAAKQAGSYVGLAPKADYDVFGGVTLSGREGQRDLMPGGYTGGGGSYPTYNPNSGSLIAQLGTGNTGYTGATTSVDTWGNPTGSAAAQAAAQQAAQQSQAYSIYEGQANDALARALKAFNDSRANVGGQYDTRINELGSQRSQTEANVNQQRTQNQQQLQSSRNAIRDSSSQGLRSLLAALGAQGAGGSSAAMFLAPEAVNSMATAQRAGAGQTFGENAQQIDTSWNNFLNNWSNEKKKVEDWRTNTERQTQSDYDNTAKTLNDILGGIRNRIQPAEAFGSQIAGIAGSIPNTIAQARTYTGETPVYNAANLSSYQLAQGPAAQVANTGGVDSNMPWLNTILNREKERKSVV